MSLFSKLFDKIEHDAKPLLKAAGEWAESEGLSIVHAVEAELAGKTGPELIELFNSTVGKELGVSIPGSSVLTSTALDLLTTGLARLSATQTATFRPAVVNAGIEQAVLLAKAQAGDTSPAPLPPALASKLN